MTQPIDDAIVPAPALLLEGPAPWVEVGIHDASRLAWNVTVPLPPRGRVAHLFELQLEVPANLAAIRDPWAALQAYARLDGADESGDTVETSIRGFHRTVASASSRLARSRDGFARHCAALRSSAAVDDSDWQRLSLWLAASRTELARARADLLPKAPPGQEHKLADEFLSMQAWAVLTDCGRALTSARLALDQRGCAYSSGFERLESILATFLKDEMTYRRSVGFEVAELANAAQLERLLARMGALKKHFERVLFLDVETYEVVNRLSGWLSALMAMVAYLWFLLWQLTLERHPVAVGSGVAMFALLTAIAYASRERLKEIGRSWIAGRVQRMFAQRVTRYRLPSHQGRVGRAVLVSARESFSQSGARRPDPIHPEDGPTHDVTLLRFLQRATVARPTSADTSTARQVRFIYRLDLSAIFPRLHDAVRGLATVDHRTGKIVIVDVPRNYELPLRATLRRDGATEDFGWVVVLNKNGLVRVEEHPPTST